MLLESFYVIRAEKHIAGQNDNIYNNGYQEKVPFQYAVQRMGNAKPHLREQKLHGLIYQKGMEGPS